MESSLQQRNMVLDEIMFNRHSIRSFSDDSPSKDEIEAIILAGRLAPFAQLAVAGKEDYRRFIVVSKSSPIMTQLAELVKVKMKSLTEILAHRMETDELFRSSGRPFYKTISASAINGVHGIGTAPYYLIVAERKGIPDSAQQSIAHCLQNMWLKATALGLGFHLVSATGQLAEDQDFCALLNLPHGEYAMDGCAIGYPKGIPSAKHVKDIPNLVTWL
ncbi:MAG TPA: nitroreductase family protein [Spirochaetia bacterium]|nr:nitroreductase family protein [Spirochaetia bacterium]